MTSVRGQVATVPERRALELQATRELSDWRVVPWALLVSGLAAGGAWVAVWYPIFWLVVAAVLAAGWWLRAAFLRRSAAAAERLMGLLVPVSSPREELAGVPASWLLPAEVDSAQQIEGMMRPSAQDALAQFRGMPGTAVAAFSTAILWFVGLVLAVFTPAFYLVATNFEPTAQDPVVFVAVVAGLPLLGLLAFADRMVALGRRQMAWLVDAAQLELPRLWALDPSFASGKAIVRSVDGYSIDVTQLAITLEPTRLQKYSRRFAFIGIGAVLLLTVLIFGLELLAQQLLTVPI